MDHLKMHSLNKIDENIAKIATLFPNCVTEAKNENGEITHKIDFDMLKQELSHSLVEGREERYQFTWPDKKQAILTANAPINKTLRPCREESVNFDETENLYIEGDNLEVLKLLQETYLGKIKMIYIDPPYNTGNDFVYNDDFRTKNLEFRKKSGNFDEEGKQLVDNYTRNTESNGRFHTDWLNMMYPRLKLARDLLSDDGVIFISLDNNEIENIKKIGDEIFGETNCLGLIANINNPKGRSDDKFIATAHEYLCVYAKDINSVIWFGFEPTEEITKRYNKEDSNGRKYREIDLRKTGENDLREDRPNLFYYFYFNETTRDFFPDKDDKEINGYIRIKPQREDGKEGNWRWGIDTAKSQINDLIPKFMPARKVWGIMQKDYLEGRALVKPTSAWTFKDVNSERGTEDFINLGFDKRIFPKPKPIGTISRCIKLGTISDSIILDFFSGSATTAHAVMQLNAEDGGNRKFIMVQLPESCDEKSEAYKAGYKNICEIGKERIRRAGKQILELSLENLEKEGVIEKYAGKLSEIRSLEEIYGFSGESLSVGEKTSERGNVCSVGSDEKSSGVDSIEYSGRTSERNQRVHSISENSKGVSCRIGDTTIDLRTLELLNNLGYRIKFESFGGDKQNDLFSDNNSNSETLSTQLSTLKSKLSVLTTLDIGFRVLKCDTSNMEDVYYTPDHLDKQDLFKNNIKSDRTGEDLLFQTMLDLGIMLSSKIETKQIDGKNVYYVEDNYLAACFDEDVTEETITKIAKEKPYYFVMRDPANSKDGDSLITNFEQIFTTYSPETIRKVL